MGEKSVYLTTVETLIMIGAIALGTMCTRFLPFLLFPDNKEIPSYVVYLGKVLPYAVISLLVVYCLKGVKILEKPYAIPEAVAIISITLLHMWKRNSLLSIGCGTIIYMILVQYFC